MSCQATTIRECRLSGCEEHDLESGAWISSVLRWSARGSTPEQIARDLEIDVELVKYHLRRHGVWYAALP